MENIKQSIETTLYSYDENEFMPIWRDGHLDNRAEFIAYKAEQFADHLGHLAARTLHAAGSAGALILDHIAQDVE